MALKKKFQQHDDYGMYVIFRGGGGNASHNGRHLGFVEIRKGMISFLILLMSFLCRGTKIFFLTAKVRNCGIFLVFGGKMTLHGVT